MKKIFLFIFLQISLLSFAQFYDEYDEYYYRYEASEEYNDVIGYIENNNIDEVKKIISNEFVHLNEKNSRGETFLSCGVANNNIKIIEYLVDKGAEIDCQDSQGVTPIMIAAFKKNMEIIKYFEKKGADIEIKDEEGHNILYYAVKGGNLEIIKYFLNKGISYDKDSLFGITLWNKQYKISDFLHSLGLKPSIKIFVGNIEDSDFNELKVDETLKKAVSYGLDINEKTEYGETLLGLSIRNNRLDILKYLLSKNVKFENISEDKDAFEYAVYYGKVDSLKLLLPKNKSINKKYGENGETLMHQACNESSNMQIIFSLLKNGANLNEKNNYGVTPLGYLFYNNKLEEINEIEKKGYKIDYKENFGRAILSDDNEIFDFVKSKVNSYDYQDSEGESPLYYAVINNDISRLKEIISKTKNNSTKDKNGKTPLHYAVEREELEVIKLLLEKGANVNIKDNEGKTPIFYTYSNKGYSYEFDKNTIELLVKNKADILVKNKEGKSFFDVVKVDNYEGISIIKMFIENKMDIPVDEELFEKAISIEEGSLIKYILEKNPEYMKLNNNDNNFIIMNIFESYKKEDRVEIIKFLINRGLDLSIKDSIGNIPVFYCKSSEELELFINKGISINYKNKNGIEDLEYIYWNNKTNESLIKKLIENGFDINKKIIDGRTYIFYCESVEEFNLLRKLGADINVIDNEGASLVEYTIKNSNKELKREMLSNYKINGIKIDDSKGEHSLLIEILLGDDVDYSLVKELIDMGADVNKIIIKQSTENQYDYENTMESPLDVAEDKNLNKKIIDLLKENGAKNYEDDEVEDKKNIAKYNENYYNLDKLEVENSKVKNVASKLLVSYISENRINIDLKILKYLVEKGVDLIGNNEETIVQNLIINKADGKYEIYKYLIENGMKYNFDFIELNKCFQESIVYTYIENNASEKDILQLLENGVKLNDNDFYKYQEFFLALDKNYSNILLKKLLGKEFKAKEMHKLLSSGNSITLEAFNKINELMGEEFNINVMSSGNENLLTTYLENNFKSIDLNLVEYLLKVGLKYNYEHDGYSKVRDPLSDEDIKILLNKYTKEEGEDY